MNENILNGKWSQENGEVQTESSNHINNDMDTVESEFTRLVELHRNGSLILFMS